MSKFEGQFVWYELTTGDIDAARAFYEPLLGWKIADPSKPGDGHKYYELQNGDHGFGGAQGPQAPGIPDHWMGYIDVSDVDGTVARALALGGTAPLPGMDLEGVGRIAVITDPSGAHLALYNTTNDYKDWSPKGSELGNFGWSEVSSDDVAKSKAFYSECFNWSAGDTMDMGDGDYHMIMLGETPIGGMYDRPPTMPMCAWTHYVNVADTDAVAAKCKALGGQVFHNQKIPGMVHFAILSDPRGAVFGVAKSLSA